MTARDIQTKAMKLPRKERSKLALALIDSLDNEDPAEIEKMWLDEAERRYRKFLAGGVKAVTAKEAIARGRKLLQR